VVVAGGPLVAAGLQRLLRRLAGDRLYFYDAIAPIVDAESIDWAHAFRASRWGKGGDEGDYVNCPLDRDQYRRFVDEVRLGRKIDPHAFEEPRYFEGCLPIEVMAARGDDALAFGPMKPVGLFDPRPGAARPYAVVQLRAENRWATSYNLVGFQTRLAWPEQKRIFALVPALARAEFLRFGSIHRNSYLHSPSLLDGELRLRALPAVRLAGQITGVEGYIESTAIGLLAARFVAERAAGRAPSPPPEETMIGGLYQHLARPRQPGEPFQPTNVNFGLLPPLPARGGKRDRRAAQVERARVALGGWLAACGVDGGSSIAAS
jgi:methylenetetrahydrofolate--tRNA-(uracil-5-)-methyltransferase